MQLQLVLPGLLWHGQVLRDISADLSLPALSWLLGRARRRWLPPAPPEAVLATAFGIQPAPGEDLPYAALRRLGDGSDGDQPAKEGYWLCLDPVCLSIGKRRLTLTTDAPLPDDNEMQAIITALTPLFHELCPGFRALHPGPSGHAYLHLDTTPDIQTTPPSFAASPESMLPQGSNALPWRKLLNEAQILLHTLPFNLQREETGQSRLNALWLWGGGTLPRTCPNPAAFTQVCGPSPLLTGLCRLAALAAPLQMDAATVLKAAPDTRALVFLDDLQSPAHQYDALAWSEALQTLERTWLQPLCQALRHGTLRHLTLKATGDAAQLELELSATARWQFWCRPLPLSHLEIPAP